MISIFKAAKGSTPQIDSIEAFNIWNLLRTRYMSIETHTSMRNFVHDRDFLLLIDKFIMDFNGQAKLLEKEAEKYKLKLPSRPPKSLKFSTEIQEITDHFVYRRLFSDLLAELLAINRAVRTSTTNDNLRKEFVDALLGHLINFQTLYKFGKLKGWTDVEPAFKTAKPTKREMVSVSEANHLWDHISQRYDQLQLTQIYLSFVHDMDFEMLLKQGEKILKEQVALLEKLAEQYEVPLPFRPPATQQATIDPEIMEDRFVFRTILTGIQSTIDLHITAVIETIRNDSLRDVFMNLLKHELKSYDGYIRFGKMKGWSKVVPMYRNRG